MSQKGQTAGESGRGNRSDRLHLVGTKSSTGEHCKYADPGPELAPTRTVSDQGVKDIVERLSTTHTKSSR